MFTKLVIDRSKWSCKAEHSPSMLYRPTNGRMCCLGFAGEALGVPIERLTAKGKPTVLSSSVWRGTPFVTSDTDDPWSTSTFSGQAIRINDNWALPVRQKEAKLKALFKTIGVTLTFTGTVSGKKSKPVIKRKVKAKRHKAS